MWRTPRRKVKIHATMSEFKVNDDNNIHQRKEYYLRYKDKMYLKKRNQHR